MTSFFLIWKHSLINFPTNLFISLLSLVSNQIKSSLSRRWPILACFSISFSKVSRCLLYLGHLVIKCISVSGSPRLHVVHSLSLGFVIFPRSDSMFSGWELRRICVTAFRSSMLSICERYGSRQKLCFSSLYVLSLFPPFFGFTHR